MNRQFEANVRFVIEIPRNLLLISIDYGNSELSFISEWLPGSVEGLDFGINGGNRYCACAHDPSPFLDSGTAGFSRGICIAIMRSVPVDPSAIIAPTARVHAGAVIGARTRIGEFCVIEQDVEIGADCLLEPYVFVKRWTTLGDRNEVSAGTVMGTDPLDKNFKGHRSYLRIGSDNKIREHYTISRGTQPESVTTIGDGITS